MLPSQSARPKSSRSHMYRRTRLNKAPFMIAMFCVIFAGSTFGVLKLWPGSKRAGSPAAADASTTANPRSGEVSPAQPIKTPPTANNATNSATNQTPPINMGRMPGATTPNQPANAPSNGAALGSEQPRNLPPTPNQSSTSSPGAMKNAAQPNPAAAANATPTNPSSGTPLPPSDRTNAPASQRLSTGLDLIARNKPVDARRTLTDAILLDHLNPAEADRARTALSDLNQRLVFGPEAVDGDPYARFYTVVSGDVLARLPRKLNLAIDWRFLKRINNLATDNLRVGQRLKVVTGPFHVVISKPDFRMDIYQGDGDKRVFVRSFPVGLGESGATPEGIFAVRPNSKLINPEWVNPRTGQRFSPDDPQNPIGERWIGLIGVSDNIRGLTTYGIHGTIDPDSIGKTRSMGCVRMRSEDVEVVYELLMEPDSRIEIHGEDYP